MEDGLRGSHQAAVRKTLCKYSACLWVFQDQGGCPWLADAKADGYRSGGWGVGVWCCQEGAAKESLIHEQTCSSICDLGWSLLFALPAGLTPFPFSGLHPSFKPRPNSSNATSFRSQPKDLKFKSSFLLWIFSALCVASVFLLLLLPCIATRDKALHSHESTSNLRAALCTVTLPGTLHYVGELGADTATVPAAHAPLLPLSKSWLSPWLPRWSYSSQFFCS